MFQFFNLQLTNGSNEPSNIIIKRKRFFSQNISYSLGAYECKTREEVEKPLNALKALCAADAHVAELFKFYPRFEVTGVIDNRDFNEEFDSINSLSAFLFEQNLLDKTRWLSDAEASVGQFGV